MRPRLVLTGIMALALAVHLAVSPAPPVPPVVVVAAPDVPLAHQKAHVERFQAIATANGGRRRSTGPGYTASVTYVYDRLVAAGFTVARQTCASGCSDGAGPNVIADWPGGDPEAVYVFGAHLDSVSAGPGANDNASGVATVLELALTVARTDPVLRAHLRFAFWTDEEQGLNGSRFYTRTLPAADRARIKGYVNLDMVGSVNGGYFVNRIASDLGRVLKAYYDSIGVPTEEFTEGVGRSDDAPFTAVGVPTSGLASGASRIKTAAQVARWGGREGPFDPCYHRACDTYPANVSDVVLGRAGDAAAHALWTLAVAGV